MHGGYVSMRGPIAVVGKVSKKERDPADRDRGQFPSSSHMKEPSKASQGEE